MCGLVGFLDRRGSGGDETLVRRMASRLVHRGPDDSGSWVDPSAGIALGFRRLAILDLSAAGHQPMVSPSGRYVIAFNGEVYNFERIRSELQVGVEVAFRGHSDTEVILAAIERWGLEAAVKRFIGMFAFALWDRETRALHLVRDRLGVKPLYYGWSGETLVFGSELKALRAHPAFDPPIDRDSVALLMRHNYVPGPRTIYERTFKLPPGTILTLPLADSGRAVPQAYWSALDVAVQGVRDPFRGSDEDARRELDALLHDAIGLRKISDVPLGVFLSGGIDSTTVAAIMQAQSSVPVRTFSIGFEDAVFDEAPFAAQVARHVGTDHTELYVTAREALEVVPRLPSIFDEPFSDSSQIPTYLVSAMARRHVTVCLSGDGGDELFGGYTRYFAARSLWNRVGWIPGPARRVAASVLRRMQGRVAQRAISVVPARAWRRMRISDPTTKLEKLAEVLGAADPDAIYHQLISHWPDPASFVLGGTDTTAEALRDPLPQLEDFTSRMMYRDLVSYLPDDILVKVDRASMAVGLESREPLLDHRLAEFAWRLPLSMKIRNGEGKWILRSVLDHYVPRTLVERPKMGFGVPLASWLRGPLREWAESLLEERRIAREGFFDPAPIREKWREHLSGEKNWHYLLWDVLVFQQWLESSVRSEASERPVETGADLSTT
jgi:asparagine synthase (glutamine-hydrolysing)